MSKKKKYLFYTLSAIIYVAVLCWISAPDALLAQISGGGGITWKRHTHATWDHTGPILSDQDLTILYPSSTNTVKMIVEALTGNIYSSGSIFASSPWATGALYVTDIYMGGDLWASGSLYASGDVFVPWNSKIGFDDATRSMYFYATDGTFVKLTDHLTLMTGNLTGGQGQNDSLLIWPNELAGITATPTMRISVATNTAGFGGYDGTNNYKWSLGIDIPSDQARLGYGDYAQVIFATGGNIFNISDGDSTWNTQFAVTTGGDVYASDTAYIGGSSGAAIQATGTITGGHDNGSSGWDVNFYGIYGGLTGGKMFWDASKDAFRAGRVTSSDWDDANVGQYSFAVNYNTKANGSRSVAMGSGTNASGDYSTAMGYGSLAAGNFSFAAGYETSAGGTYSTALGFQTSGSGSHGIAAGQWVRAGTTGIGNTITLGRGISAAQRLNNYTAKSMMVGFDTNAATLFVGTGANAGNSGATGTVGINTATPSVTLDVKGDFQTTDSAGNAVFSVDTVGQVTAASATIGGGYAGGSGVDIDTAGNVFMNGKLTVDGAIDPTNIILSGNIATPIVDITQAGAGNDIEGTSDLWYVTAAGAVHAAEFWGDGSNISGIPGVSQTLTQTLKEGNVATETATVSDLILTDDLFLVDGVGVIYLDSGTDTATIAYATPTLTIGSTTGNVDLSIDGAYYGDGSNLTGIPQVWTRTGTDLHPTTASDSVTIDGALTVGDDTDDDGYDVKFHSDTDLAGFEYIQASAALRVGLETTGAWNPSNIGLYSIDVGALNQTMGANYAAVFGYNNISTGTYSFAAGFNHTIKGSYATALGYDHDGNGDAIFMGGSRNDVSGDYGVAIGRSNTVREKGAAIGWDCDVTDVNSYCYGYDSDAAGQGCTAVGYNVSAGGVGSNYSASFGANVDTTGWWAFSIGYGINNTGGGATTIGRGVSIANPLANAVDSSVCLGVDTTVCGLLMTANNGGGVGATSTITLNTLLKLIETEEPGAAPAANSSYIYLDTNTDDLTIMWDSGATAAIAVHP